MRRSEGFLPQRANVCDPRVTPAIQVDSDRALHGWSGPRNANHTLVPHRWSPQSEVLIDSGVLTPGARGMYKVDGGINPLTSIGSTSRVREWANPYPARARGNLSSGPCSSARSVYDLQPGEPGRLLPKSFDSTDSTMWGGRYYYQPSYADRRTAPAGGPYEPIGNCPSGPIEHCPERRAGFDVDTDHSYGQRLDEIGSGEEYLKNEWLQGSPHGGWSSACGRPEARTNHPADVGTHATREFHKEMMQTRQHQEMLQAQRAQQHQEMLQARRRQEMLQAQRAQQHQEMLQARRRQEMLQAQQAQQAQQHREMQRARPRRETLRSRRTRDEPITGVMHGLGSTWVDPRFQPGPQNMYPGNDAHWAHGGHAGGPTFGALIPHVFEAGGAWNQKYVHGTEGGPGREGEPGTLQWVDAA